MAQRSKIMQLPPEIKERLDKELVTRGFGDYDAVTDLINTLLAEAGFEIQISKSGLHRYGQAFEDKLSAIRIATEQAKAITNEVGDDAGQMGSALISLVQEKCFSVLTSMNEVDPEKINFPKFAEAVAKLNNASVIQKRFQAEVQKKAHEAAERVSMIATTSGLSNTTIQTIRKEILGIAS